MKIAMLIARVLLGFLFIVFGLNGFLHFIPNRRFRARLPTNIWPFWALRIIWCPFLRCNLWP
ncbi:MAG TPA: hypothetical protein VF627_16175, partial [Abditibacterium sp.]